MTNKVMSVFSSFVSGDSFNIALTVTLFGFKVFKLSMAVNPFWTMSADVSFAKYELVRSVDGYVFYTIGAVPATSFTSLKNYNLLDNSSFNWVNFYRIKMIDMDS